MHEKLLKTGGLFVHTPTERHSHSPRNSSSIGVVKIPHNYTN